MTMAKAETKPRVLHVWPKYPTKDDRLKRIVDNGETGYDRRVVLEQCTGADAMGVAQWAEVLMVYPHGRSQGRDEDEAHLSRVLLLEIVEIKREAELREDKFAAHTKKLEDELANAKREIDRFQQLADGPMSDVARGGP